jgi:hypothetical protein
MPALCIVEDPSLGGIYTCAIAPHTGTLFENIGYVAKDPLQGLPDLCQHIPPGTPAQGYTHILLVGSPAFIAKQPQAPGLLYGAYVLSDTQFIPAEQVGWVDAIPRIAVPSAITGGALSLASGKQLTCQEVRPWGLPVAPKSVINRTEIRQLLVPAWDHTAPVILTYAEHVDDICAMLSRTKNINVLLLGEEDAQQAVRLDLCGLKPEQVRFTKSALAWDAADLYLALNPFTAWPWDIVQALSRQLPVAAINNYVYETFIADGFAAPIGAFDTVTIGTRLAYKANSTDLVQTIGKFTSDPVALHTRAQIGSQTLASHTQEKFAKGLIRALFSDS